MDWVGWFGLVVFCSLWIRASAVGIKRKFLSNLHEASPVLMEIGYWNFALCVWAVFSIFSILSISMARLKNTRKGKTPSSSMEWAVKKRKSDTSQTIKKSKGKRRDSSSESEEASESEDEEIEAMFAEASDSEQEKCMTPQTRGSFDYPSTHGIQVDVGLPDATSENRAESPLYGELYPNTIPV